MVVEEKTRIIATVWPTRAVVTGVVVSSLQRHTSPMARNPVIARSAGLSVLLVAGSLLVASCADRSGDDDGAANIATSSVGEQIAASPDREVASDGSVRRELALDVRDEAAIATNLLPSVEVHDLGRDRMANFRNIFPAERPVLLWMWAPY